MWFGSALAFLPALWLGRSSGMRAPSQNPAHPELRDAYRVEDLESREATDHWWLPFVAGVVVGGVTSLGPALGVPAARAADLVNGEAIFDARRAIRNWAVPR
ncbi:unnamed protein product [Cladocopium goreaui]|uniref:Uncharacterized protein n=1 Tax=Cladocopium goreaui TaxID=2562237 RepID=A0A9P1BF58_9DINO|nr:unnamed protein product [Cladocopium goreaui]